MLVVAGRSIMRVRIALWVALLVIAFASTALAQSFTNIRIGDEFAMWRLMI